MGRLLRKKDPTRKIRKTQSADETDQERSVPAIRGGASPVARKSYTPAAKSTSSRDSAAPNKLIRSVRETWEKSIQFLREVKTELKKVTWPTRKQTVGSTVVVLVIVAIVSLFLGVVDAGLSGIIRVVLQ
ncbi:preprotein translocase subunit SecE [Desulfosarcina sp. OttesenSCG-928-A07]|nr:preprotein translocase subunit SecE [Desulfosarcina sp. OttesenSCG-928-G17]MDL2329183.1 preprotein translocase subunit SecE [Desulfosarcina sp. OttesenSCG-928-A07]